MRAGVPRLYGLVAVGLAVLIWSAGTRRATTAQESPDPAPVSAGAAALVVRSDGRLFLVRDGRKHAVPTLALPDEALEAIPEGEPVMDLLSPVSAPQAAAAAPLPTPRVVVVTATPGPSGPPTPVPTAVGFGTPVRSQKGGEPGATGGSRDGPWEYTITGAERPDSLYGKRPKGVYVVVYATLTSFSRTAGQAGDGREVRLSDAQGRFYEPLYDALYDARRPKGLPLPHDPIWPDQPFDTAWVYDIPPDASGLRLILSLGVMLDLGVG